MKNKIIDTQGECSMEKTSLSNYDRLSEEWRQRFLSMDQKKLLAKLPELKDEGEYLVITHFGRTFGIHKNHGNIIILADEIKEHCQGTTMRQSCQQNELQIRQEQIDNSTKMNIYNLLWYSKDNGFFHNHWVPFRNVKGAGPFAPAFEKNVIKPFAMTFAGKTELLKEAAEKLGGEAVRQGDAGYILKAFECIPMQYLFWDEDDEFQAQANILFDYSVTDFIHVESTVSLAVAGVERLAEAAGIKTKGNVFGM